MVSLFPRLPSFRLEKALKRQAVVALTGPRQIGKTTLALEVGREHNAVYLDLESVRDRAKIADPALFLDQNQNRLVILDEIHRTPGLFEELRGQVDAGRRSGHGTGRFLVLGSAGMDLLRQTGETLAGRIEVVPVGGLTLLETGVENGALLRLWNRGGFPLAFLGGDWKKGGSDEDSLSLRTQFVHTFLERDVPLFGMRIPATTLERFWTMLAHCQGELLNKERHATSLGVSAPTVQRYIDLLCDLGLVRCLPPYLPNVGKRLVKSPKVYIRDSGLVHALLGIETQDDLEGHPVCGSSWEGFVTETLLSVAPPESRAYFYRTVAGAEVDLVLDMGGHHGLWVMEIKRTLAPSVSRSLAYAVEAIRPSRAFLVYPGTESYPVTHGVTVTGLQAITSALAQLSFAPNQLRSLPGYIPQTPV